MTGLWLALVLAAGAPEAPAAADTPEATACPAPRTVQPRYPLKQARENKTGLVLVGARFDACGRVVETRVDKSSGITAFDEAALVSVAGYVLSAEQQAKAEDGWVQAPVRFGGFRTVVPRDIPWPKSHRKPRYLPDEQPFPFDSLAAFKAARPDATDVTYNPPYRMAGNPAQGFVHTSLVPDAGDPAVFWFRYTLQPPHPASDTEPLGASTLVGVARYRLVMEDREPVVRLSLLCERTAEECERLRAFLFEGLPFAKPRRR